MITIKTYAEMTGVSYEAVRRQVVRYSKELEKHVKKDGRALLLDDEAVAFLNQHRLPQNIVVESLDEGTRNLIKQLTEENNNLKVMIQDAQRKCIEALESNNELQRNQNTLLLEMKDRETELKDRETEMKEQLAKVEQNVNDLGEQLAKAEKEVSSFKKTWFGLYRKE